MLDATTTHRTCPRCGVNLFIGPHRPTCPARAEVYRISFDEQGQRMESLLESCNRRALKAWAKEPRP
jgi:hypothetical protein